MEPMEQKVKYPNSYENIMNRQASIYAVSIDIATNLGKIAVLSGEKKEQAQAINSRFINILSYLLSKHTVKTKDRKPSGRPQTRKTSK